MSKRPAQAKFSFEKEGEVEIKVPEENPTFKVGDKIKMNPEYSNVKGIYVVDSILLEWEEPLYIISQTDKNKKEKSNSCPKCGTELEDNPEDSSEGYCPKCNYGWRFPRRKEFLSTFCEAERMIKIE